MFTKKLEKIFSIVLLVSLSFGISNAATTFTSADFDYVKNHINNMRNSSYDSGILGGIFERVFDDEGKIRDAFYNFVNTATEGYIPLWEDAKFVDSPIYSTGGQVGIGTTTLSEKVTIDGGLSLTKDPDSGDDVGDRAYNDARYLMTGAVATDANLLDGLDSLVFQKRVAGICPAGESIRVINEDGTVVCEVDDSAALTVGANYLAKSDGSGLVNSSVYETGTGVGIGTTTPSVDFEVAGDIRANTLGTTCVGNCGTSLPPLMGTNSTVNGDLSINGTTLTNDLDVTANATFGSGIGVTGDISTNGGLSFPTNGTMITRAPRVIYTPDTRAGCPAAGAVSTDLYTQSFTLSNTAQVFITLNTIVNYAGRADTYIYVDGVMVRQTLTGTNSASWKPVNIMWGGTLAAGNHVVSIRSNRANSLGCGETWGSITTLIFE